ncbi:penicillin-binding protein, partial [Paraburkholderia sp. BR14261]
MPIIKRPPSPQYPNEDREPSFNHGRQPPRRPESGGGSGGNGPRDGSPKRRSFGTTLALWFGGLIGTLCVVGALLVGYALVVMEPQLPSLDALTNYQP